MALMRVSTFWRHVSVRGAIADFREVFAQAGENRWRIAALAAVATCASFWLIAREEFRGRPQPPKIDYITSFRPDRTEQEIIASNIAEQRIRDQLDVEQARRDEEVRQIYVKLGRMSGMDVEAIERRAAAELTPRERAERERLRRLAAAMEAGNGQGLAR
jgi:hypothetical protein